jgi:hypothetical protein
MRIWYINFDIVLFLIFKAYVVKPRGYLNCSYQSAVELVTVYLQVRRWKRQYRVQNLIFDIRLKSVLIDSFIGLVGLVDSYP